MKKNTKIVATIGPATDSEEVLSQLLSAGMNVARFNTKHADPKWHNERIQRVKNVAKKANQAVATLLDLQGPEIRIETPQEKALTVKKNDVVIFTSNRDLKEKNTVFVPQLVIDALGEEDEILLDDGACELHVTEKAGDRLSTVAIADCTIGHRKTMNTPGVVLEVPSLTDRDFKYLDGVKPSNVDYVGLSFVRDANDIQILRAELEKRKFQAEIIAKIENQSALDNLEEIVEISDAVMVARGDLGVEVPYQELSYWQKTIIEHCRLHSKPVITATHMLKSMVTNPRPTRAEVSDVTNAIYDGTDAVMLSEETTIGEYPVRAVSIQATISEFNEDKADLWLPFPEEANFSQSVAHAAADLIANTQLDIDHIVCLTETGQTLRHLTRFRPLVPVMGVTHDESTFHKMSLYYGVTPYLIKGDFSKMTDKLGELLLALKKDNFLHMGETVLIIHGQNWGRAGYTNSLSLLEVQ